MKFLTRWNGWDPSSRLLITKSTHAGDGPVDITNWFVSHSFRGKDTKGADGSFWGLHVVWLKYPSGLLECRAIFWILVYTTCVCCATWGIAWSIEDEDGTSWMLRWWIRIEDLVWASDRGRGLWLKGKVWFGVNAGLAYLKHLVEYQPEVHRCWGVRWICSYSWSNWTATVSSFSAFCDGGRRMKSIRCPG